MPVENVLLETTQEQQKKSMSSGDGDVVDEVVVEIKSAVVGCILGVSSSYIHHNSGSNTVGISSALFLIGTAPE